MDCNRDEAIRAKEIAEKKMQNNDFDGARKIAKKAQQLCCDLENITQLLAVCDVHCSAQIRVLGIEKDWYGILQLDKKVDEVTIKKQYRKLALVLHPDKNQFPGAEAAFKLIGEAHLVLSDSGKKAAYDSKIGALSKYAPPYQVHGSMVNGDVTRLNVQKNQQAAQFNAASMQQRFWTQCPFCKIKYQYYRHSLNLNVSCQSCKKVFMALDTGVPPESNWTRAVPQGVSVPPRSTYQNQAASHGIPPKIHNQNQYASQGIPTAANASQPSAPHATYKTAEKNTGFKPLHSRSPPNLGGASSWGDGPNGVAAPRVHHMKPVEDCRNNKRKGKRKLDAEPTESFSSSSSSDFDEVVLDAAAAQSDGFHELRRSSRQKHNISYEEPEIEDDDLVSPLKGSQKDESFCGSEVPQEAAYSFNKETSAFRGAPEEHAPSCKSEIGGKPSDELNDGVGVETIDDSDSESCFEDDGCETYSYPDPEFHDFNKDREENCFRVNQLWACYDESDCMPRYYAKIKEVRSSPFKLWFYWLECKPNNSNFRDWIKSGLPVACGNYRRSYLDSGSITDSFSHQIESDTGKSKESFRIYPRSGETWALFRDWDFGWVNDRPERYAYDIVEVLSEFTDDDGIQVTSLEKVNRFKCLYHRNIGGKIISIPSKEMLRFSHRIPSFKMMGGEKDGVPAGSFELDGASLDIKQEADPKDPYDSKMPKTASKKFDEDTNIISSPSTKKEASSRNSSKISCGFSPSEADLVTEEVNAQIPDQSPRRGRRIHVASSPSRYATQKMFHDFTCGRSAENFAAGQLWALYNSENKLPNVYGKIKMIQSPPLKVKVALLGTCLQSESGIRSVCGTFKVKKEIQVVEPSLFSHVLDMKPSKRDTIEIYPEKGQIWALHKNHILSSDPRNYDYDIVEILSKSEESIEVLHLVKLKDYKSVFGPVRKHGSSGGTLKIQLKDIARFSHQIPAFKLTTEGGGNLTGYWELDPVAVPSNI